MSVLQSTATYLCGPRGPEYRRDDTQAEGTYTDGTGTHPAGKTRWYVFDGLGSVVGEVDPSGNTTSSGTFDVYGAKRQGGTGAATSRQGFVGSLGHVSDAETGLVYMRARYYDPSVGRFVSEDPKADGINWFAYCDNNPVNKVDASGEYTNPVRVEAFTAIGEVFLFMAVVASQQGRYSVATTEAGMASAMFGIALTGGGLSASASFERAMFAAIAPAMGWIRAMMVEAGAASNTLVAPIVLMACANALICLGVLNSIDAEAQALP